MLGMMHNPAVAIVTLITTALEEAVLRCTMVYRDELWDWITGAKEELDEAELNWKRLVQTASAANSMRAEITSILVTRAVFMLFRPHRFAFVSVLSPFSAAPAQRG